MPERLKITAYSTALYSTWIFVEDLKLLFDVGDGVCAQLLGKTRKIRTVAITHADRDHVTGLLQLQHLNAQAQPLQVLYPADSGSFPALAGFCAAFDPDSGPNVTWTPVSPGDRVELTPNIKLGARRNSHLPSELTKSLSYFVIRENRKLKPEHMGKTANELAAIRGQLGEAGLTFIEEEIILAYSGDTGVGDPETWRGCNLLFHESTFLRIDDRAQGAERTNQHSVLSDVLVMARDAGPKSLVLNHFSSRYESAEIRSAVASQAQDLGIDFPIYIIPPGETVVDVLAGNPVWPV